MENDRIKGGNVVAKQVRIEFAKSLKAHIKRKGLKQGEFAKMIGCSDNGLSAILNGHSFPTRYLERMCHFLGTELVMVEKSSNKPQQ